MSMCISIEHTINDSVNEQVTCWLPPKNLPKSLFDYLENCYGSIPDFANGGQKLVIWENILVSLFVTLNAHKAVWAIEKEQVLKSQELMSTYFSTAPEAGHVILLQETKELDNKLIIAQQNFQNAKDAFEECQSCLIAPFKDSVTVMEETTNQSTECLHEDMDSILTDKVDSIQNTIASMGRKRKHLESRVDDVVADVHDLNERLSITEDLIGSLKKKRKEDGNMMDNIRENARKYTDAACKCQLAMQTFLNSLNTPNLNDEKH
ncbi:hypothetical protein CPB84DRAFT_1747043 [Gymnopilus junonius]|uniref:Uncharacterized protein n=1 Tax=Gymnopilus junonius TaxID=109634 RepID=A0A9P5TPA9_GYMJU|nr:hypothetical protein CPB84DRAFT_1747043 [Gymnopilus junonius]